MQGVALEIRLNRCSSGKNGELTLNVNEAKSVKNQIRNKLTTTTNVITITQ